jgi:nitrile hydratase accessory protein
MTSTIGDDAMLTNYEHYAMTEMLDTPGTPPRLNGRLCFRFPWERQAFGMALSLSKAGYFEWASFQSNLIAAIKAWEQTHALDDPSWDYYECWLAALETTLLESSLATASEFSTALTDFDEAPPSSGSPSSAG